MKITEYNSIIEKTAVYPENVNNFGLAYAFLGLLEELNELKEAVRLGRTLNIAKEAGDCYWYIALITKITGISLDKIIIREKEKSYYPAEISKEINGEISDTIMLLTSECGRVKRYYRDNDISELENIEKVMEIIAKKISKVYTIYGFSTSEILALNYDKLISRLKRDKLHGKGDNR